MAIEAGAAYVTILPSAKGFSTKLRSAITKDIKGAGVDAGSSLGNEIGSVAAKKSSEKLSSGVKATKGLDVTGKALGSTIGDAIGTEAGKKSSSGLAAGISKGSEGVAGEGTKVGSRFGGLFSKAAGKSSSGVGEEIKKGTAPAAEAGATLGSRFSEKFGGTMKKGMGSVMSGLGGIVAGIGLASLVGKMVSEASEGEQAIGAVTAIFKQHADQIETSAKSAAQNLGLSANQYRNLASSLGAQLKNKGIKDFADQTERLIQLGADMAAQFGGSTAEAVDALNSALRGESNPIERYGVSINMAAVEAKALAMGVQKVNGQLTDQQKAMVMLTIVTEQTKDAQGTFGRESDTHAGRMERAKASVANLVEQLGNFLLPLFSDLANKLNQDVVPAIAGFVQNFKDGTGIAGTMKGALETLGTVLGTTTSFVKDNSTAVGTLTIALVAGFAAYKTISIVTGIYTGLMKLQAAGSVQAMAAQLGLNSAMFANPIGIVIIAITALIAALVYLYNNNETVRKAFDAGWKAIKAVVGAVASWFAGVAGPMISGAWERVKNLFLGYWNLIDTMVFKPFRWALETLPGFFEVAQKSIVKIWDKIKSAAEEPVKFVVNTIIKDGLAAAWNAVAGKLGLGTWDFKGMAAGGRVPGPAQRPGVDNLMGVVNGRTPIRIASGEWVIPNKSVAAYGPAAMSAVQHGTATIIPGYAGGGQVYEYMWAWARKNLPGMQLTSSYRPGSNDYHGQGKAIDLADAMTPAGKGAMLSAASIIYSTFGPQILELIHTPLGANKQLKHGKPINYGEATLAQHVNHVHWAMENFTEAMAGAPAAAGGALMNNPLAEGLKLLLAGPLGLASKGIGQIGNRFGNTPYAEMVTSFAKKPFDGMKKFLEDKIDALFPQLNSSPGSYSGGGADSWLDTVKQALEITGQGDRYTETLLRRMQKESGGNPRAINNWDSNAAAGIPSKGLMQVIDPTFKAYAMKGYNTDIYDPLSNIIASIRYAVDTYGSLGAAYSRPGGYAEGGQVLAPTLYDRGGYLPPGLNLVANNTGRPELVLTNEQQKAMGGSTSITINTVDRDNVGELVGALNHAGNVARLGRRFR